MKRLTVLAITLSVAACGGGPDIVDRGGRSLDVPVPSSGVAAAKPTGHGRDIFDLPDRPKQDPTALGLKSGKYGRYLVDGAGRALYAFSDDAPGLAACLTNCATVWPPVIVKKLPKVNDPAIDGSRLSMLPRLEGSQLSYSGLLLYYSDSDLRPDDTWGHYALSFGGRFTLVGADGKPLPAPK